MQWADHNIWKEGILGHLKNNTCCAMWWARYSHSHTVFQGLVPRERNIISHYHRLYFRFFITLIHQDLALWMLSGFLRVFSVYLNDSGYDTVFPVFNEAPKYNKYGTVVEWSMQQT